MAFKMIKEKLLKIRDTVISIHDALEREDKDGNLQEIDISSEDGMVVLKEKHPKVYSIFSFAKKAFSFLMKLVSFLKDQNIIKSAISM